MENASPTQLSFLNHFNNVLKDDTKKRKDEMLSHFNSQSTQKIETDLFFVVDMLHQLIANKNIGGLNRFFNKFNLEHEHVFDHKLKDVILSSLDPDVFKILINNHVHISHMEFLKEVFENSNTELLSFMLDFKDDNGCGYFLTNNCSIYKLLFYSFSALKTNGALIDGVGSGSDLKCNLDDAKCIEFLNMIKNSEEGKKIINMSWSEDFFKSSILLDADEKRLSILKDFFSVNPSWENALATMFQSPNPANSFSCNNFNKFNKNIHFLQNAKDDLQKLFDRFKKEQDNILSEVKREVKHRKKHKKGISSHERPYSYESWSEALNLGLFESIYIITLSNHYSRYPPKNIIESFLLYNENHEVDIYSCLINDDEAKKEISKSLSNYGVFLSWIVDKDFHSLSKILSSIDELKDWRDSTNNTIAHYLVSICQNLNEFSDITEIKSVIKAHPSWFTSKNDMGFTAIDILEKIVLESENEYGESNRILILNSLISEVQKYKMKEEINPKRESKSRLKKF